VKFNYLLLSFGLISTILFGLKGVLIVVATIVYLNDIRARDGILISSFCVSYLFLSVASESWFWWLHFFEFRKETFFSINELVGLTHISQYIYPSVVYGIASFYLYLMYTRQYIHKQDTPMNEKSTLNSNQILLGSKRHSNRNYYINMEDLNTHVLVLGTTGSGKTVSLSNIVEYAIENHYPIIYVDGKGDSEYGDKFVSFSKQQGQESFLFNLGNVKNSCTYNPMYSGGYTSLKDRIIDLRHWSEEHYKKIAEGYLQTVFKVLHCCNIRLDLASLIPYLDRGNLLNLVRENKATINSQELMDEIEALEFAEKDILSLVFELKNFINSEVGELFKTEQSTNNLVLESLIENNQSAYFSLASLEFPMYAKTLGKLIINDIKAAVNVSKKKVFVVFDEFSVFAGPQVLNLINMGRSAGIHGVISTQSLSDISMAVENNGEAFVQQILSNCNNYMVHRLNSPNDAETLSALIGTKNNVGYTAQVSELGATGLGTVRNTKEFLFHPDDIKQLKRGEAIIVNKNKMEFGTINARLGNLYL
jgi:conjugal transfer pilus assembly protein TraD